MEPPKAPEPPKPAPKPAPKPEPQTAESSPKPAPAPEPPKPATEAARPSGQTSAGLQPPSQVDDGLPLPNFQHQENPNYKPPTSNVDRDYIRNQIALDAELEAFNKPKPLPEIKFDKFPNPGKITPKEVPSSPPPPSGIKSGFVQIIDSHVTRPVGKLR